MKWIRTLFNRYRPRPQLSPGEQPLLIFLSSVMTSDLQWARDEVVTSLTEVPYLISWAFEYTPASSEDVDQSYLRHVREAAFLVWLAGDDVTQPVIDEVHEALANGTRIIALILPSRRRSRACEELIDRVRPHAKYRKLSTGTRPEFRHNLNAALSDEIVRAVRGLPGMGRLALIEERGRASRARVIERFQATGVSVELASVLADEVAMGAVASATPTAERPLVVLSAEVGAGKSLCGERVHQASLARYLNDSTAPIPVWIPVREVVGQLEAAITSRCSGLGEPRQQGAAVILDGADEVGPGPAAEVLAAARILVRTWPATTALITTRPIPSFGDDAELARLAPLSEQQVRDLIGRVANRDITFGIVAGWPQTVREAITRPLFALLLGRALAEGGDVPASRAQLVARLADQASGERSEQVEPLLRRLAVESLRRGGGPVPASEVGSPVEVEALLGTRLVVRRGDAVFFPLIIFAQWFAAASLAEGTPAIHEVVARPEAIDEWLYPLALCAALYPHEVVTRLLAPLSQQNPGFVALVVEEALARWSVTDVPAPPSLGAARRVRTATESWVAGIGLLADLITQTRADGSLAALGAQTDDSRLTLVWYRGDDRGDVFELPPGFDLFRAGPEWGNAKMARPGEQAAWAWRWSLEELTAALSDVLKNGALPLDGNPLIEPAVYQAVAHLNNHGSLTADSFDLEATHEKLKSGFDAVRRLGGTPVRPLRLYAEIEARVQRGQTVLSSPLPGPDRATESGWVWGPYSPERLLERTVSVYEMALAGYEAFVNRWFGSLASRMLTAVTLPAVLRGSVTPPTSPQYEDGPLIFWHWEPLPTGEPSRVELTLGDDQDYSGWDRARFDDHVEYFRENRRAASRWASPVFQSSVLHVFQIDDATRLAYTWLWDDLKRIQWVSGGSFSPASSFGINALQG